MDSISVDADSGVSRINRAPLTPAQKSETKTDNGAEASTNLTDVQALAAKVDSTGPEVRPEVVERGKALASTPNWPDDDVLDKLAEKLIDSEDFGS